MAKLDTLQGKVQAIAKAVSREPLMDVLANALRKAPQHSKEHTKSDQELLRYHAEVRNKIEARTKRARASRVGFRRYEVTHNPRFRPGTWRAFMVATICACEDTRVATAKHRESGEYPDKTLDFNWCVKQGYIAYKA